MDDALIRQMVDRVRSQFETWVLACTAHNLAFYRQFSPVICTPHDGAKFTVFDFETAVDNVVYEIIRRTRELTADSEVDKLPRPLVYSIVQQLYVNPLPPDPRKGPGVAILQHELPQVLQRVEQVLTFPSENLPGVVAHGVGHWISKVRMQRLSLATRDGNFDPGAHAELTANIQRHVLAAAEPDHVFDFGAGMDEEREFLERLKVPSLSRLDETIGGGFACGEGTLVVATQGSGKTVLATQIAGTNRFSSFRAPAAHRRVSDSG